MRPRIVITRPELPGDLAGALGDGYELVWRDEGRSAGAAELTELVDGVDGLLSVSSDELTGEVAEAARSLRVIASYGAGLDNCDLAAFTRAGIPVGHTPGVVAESTADVTWALILGVARRLPEVAAEVRAGRWPGADLGRLLGIELAGSTLGIVGYGGIGRAEARRAHGFGMRVQHFGRTRRSDEWSTWVTLEELVATSDVISVHTPLTDQTRRIIDATFLAGMKRSAILVNTSRGQVVDQPALIEALRAGSIAGAGLDVTDPEPLPPDHQLYELTNCVVLPHIGTATVQARAAMTVRCAENLVAGLGGERVPYCANPEVYDRLDDGTALVVPGT